MLAERIEEYDVLEGGGTHRASYRIELPAGIRGLRDTGEYLEFSDGNGGPPVLHTAMVAPVTSTIRGIPSEVVLGHEDGLKHDSAASLDHVQTVEKHRLKRFLGRVRPERLRALCTALAVAVGCDDT